MGAIFQDGYLLGPLPPHIRAAEGDVPQSCTLHQVTMSPPQGLPMLVPKGVFPLVVIGPALLRLGPMSSVTEGKEGMESVAR